MVAVAAAVAAACPEALGLPAFLRPLDGCVGAAVAVAAAASSLASVSPESVVAVAAAVAAACPEALDLRAGLDPLDG